MWQQCKYSNKPKTIIYMRTPTNTDKHMDDVNGARTYAHIDACTPAHIHTHIAIHMKYINHVNIIGLLVDATENFKRKCLLCLIEAVMLGERNMLRAWLRMEYARFLCLRFKMPFSLLRFVIFRKRSLRAQLKVTRRTRMNSTKRSNLAGGGGPPIATEANWRQEKFGLKNSDGFDLEENLVFSLSLPCPFLLHD